MAGLKRNVGKFVACALICGLFASFTLPPVFPFAQSSAVKADGQTIADAGYKSENFAYSKYIVGQELAFGADMRAVDNHSNTALGLGARDAGFEQAVTVDMTKVWTKDGNGASEDSIASPGTAQTPTFNKVVFTAKDWNTLALDLVAGSEFAVEPPAPGSKLDGIAEIADETKLASRDIYSVRGEPTSADTEQVFSFDAQTEKLIGFRFHTWLNANPAAPAGSNTAGATLMNETVNAVPNELPIRQNSTNSSYRTATVREFQVYYVTPAAIAEGGPTAFPASAGTKIQLDPRIYDCDGDEILDSNFRKFHIATDDETVEINPLTGEMTVLDDIEGTKTIQVTYGLDAAVGEGIAEAVKKTIPITLYGCSDPQVPVSLEAQPMEDTYQLTVGQSITPPAVTVMNGSHQEISGVPLIWQMKVCYLDTDREMPGALPCSIDASTGTITWGGQGPKQPCTIYLTAKLGGKYGGQTDDMIDFGLSKSWKFQVEPINILKEAAIKSSRSNTGIFSGAGAERLFDGNYATVISDTQNKGANNNHLIAYQIGDANGAAPLPKYNKAVIWYAEYNTNELIIYYGDADATMDTKGNVTNRKEIARKTIRQDYTTPNVSSGKQVFSFDAIEQPYFNIINKSLKATNGKDAWQDRPDKIAEIELYYVEPAKVQLDGIPDVISSKLAQSIVLSPPKILDAEGDEIADASMTGFVWSVAGEQEITDKISFDGNTMNLSAPVSGTVTLRASSTYNPSLYAEQTITFVAKEISALEISGIPETITKPSNALYGKAQYQPSLQIIGPDGEIENAEVVWSLKEAKDGVSIDSKTGLVTVDPMVEDGAFTICCAASGAGEDAKAEYTVTVGAKPTDVLQNSVSWYIAGWPSDEEHLPSDAVDGNSETYYNAGAHNSNNIKLHFDLQAQKPVTHVRFRMSEVDKTHGLRIMGGNELVLQDGTSAAPPQQTNTTYNSSADLPWISPHIKGTEAERFVSGDPDNTLYWGSTPGLEDQVLPAKAPLTAVDNFVTVAGGKHDVRYLGLFHYYKGNAQTWSLYDFEAYGDAPGTAVIQFPTDPIDVENQTVVPLEAWVEGYFGKSADDFPGTSVWSASGAFTINSTTGELGGFSTSGTQTGTITYTYKYDWNGGTVTLEAQIRAKNEDGVLSFSTAASSPDFTVEEPHYIEGEHIYVYEGMTAAEFKRVLTPAPGVELFVCESDGTTAVTDDTILTDSNILRVEADNHTLLSRYRIAYFPIKLTNDGHTYTASVPLNTWAENGTMLIIAEYTPDGSLVSLKMAAKSEPEQSLAAVLENVGEGNVVKAMLFSDWVSLKPLKPAVQS